MVEDEEEEADIRVDELEHVLLIYQRVLLLVLVAMVFIVNYVFYLLLVESSKDLD